MPTAIPCAVRIIRNRLLPVLLLTISLRDGYPWAFPPSQAQNIELRGQMGGACSAVTVTGSRLLIGQGPRLTTVDVSVPSQPRELASLLLPATVTDIAWQGNLACVLADTFRIIESGTDGSLRELASLPVAGSRLVTTGTLVYILGKSMNIRVVDIRHPDIPVLIADFALPHGPQETAEPTGIVTKGHYAFVSYKRLNIGSGIIYGGFMVLDTSDPKTPYVVTDFRWGFPTYGVALDGDSLYLIVDRWLYLFDVRQPLGPVTVGSVAGPVFPYGITLQGNRAYVTAVNSEIRSYALQGIDLPRELLRIQTPGEAAKTAASSNRLFVADGWAGLRIFDGSAGSSLVEIGRLTVASDASDVAVAGNYAYLADGRLGLSVLSLANPDQPKEVARFQTAGSAGTVRLAGSRAYVAEGPAGLEILDVSDPARPLRLGQLATTATVLDVAVQGNYALIANGPAGLGVVRVSDPSHPAVIGQSSSSTYAVSVTGIGNRAFVCDQSGARGLWEYDLSQPDRPVVRKRLPELGAPAQAALEGFQLAVAETDVGLHMVDVTWPGMLLGQGGLKTAGWFQGVALKDHLVYVADSNLGLQVINAVDPYFISQSGFFPTAGQPRRVAVAGGRAYLAAGSGGLYVLRYLGAPDLNIRDFDFDPQDVKAGTELRLSGEIVNESTTPTAVGVWAQVFVSRRRDFSEPRWLLCPPLWLEPGLKSLNLANQRFVVLSSVPKGVYTVGIIVDADNNLAELSKNNNAMWLLSKPLYVGPRPAAVQSWMLYR